MTQTTSDSEPMNTRPLGNSDLHITPIGFGAWALGGCEANNVGVIVYSPMASGLLTGAMSAERAAKLPAEDWRSKNAEFQPPKLAQNLALAERLLKVAERHGRTAGQAAIESPLRLPAVTGATVRAHQTPVRWRAC